MNKKNNGRIVKYLALSIAFLAICWDISVSTLDVAEGTFKLESDFAPLNAIPATVSIVTSDYPELSSPLDRSVDPSYEQIEEMVSAAVDLQGGFEGVIEAGDTVLIKVNLVGANNPSGDGTNTDVRVVKGLVRKISDYTEGDVVIQIAEGTARTNDDPTDPNSVWGIGGYIDLLSDPYLDDVDLHLVNLNQTIDDLVEVDLGARGSSAAQGNKYYIHKAELNADVYIAVPVLKIHNTGITNVMKLQVGTAPGCYYGYNKTGGTELCPEGLIHEIEHRDWRPEMIVDLCTIADIDFVVVDAVMCLETKKTNANWNQVRFNTIIAGKDPVATDHVSARIMGLNPDDVAHITLGEKMNLGTNDPELINLVGVSLDQARKIVKKSQSSMGRFGQSNRTWIVSPVFADAKISDELYVDEALIEPLPGEQGWSEPVYFYDDRIDLLSYYSGQTDIVTYAFTYFNAVKDQEAELWLGTQEAIKVFLNGEEVYSFSSVASYADTELGEKKAIVEIKEGRNTLLVKSLNKFGDYSWALNICEVESDPDYYGNRVDGLKFYIDDSGSGAVVNENVSNKMKDVAALRCFPNPAENYARISFNLAEKTHARIGIYDMKGRLINMLGNGVYNAGNHTVTWELDDENATRVSKGMYICKITSEKGQQSLKIIVK